MSATEKREKGKAGRVLRIYRRAFGMMRREFGGYMTAEIMDWVLVPAAPIGGSGFQPGFWTRYWGIGLSET